MIYLSDEIIIYIYYFLPIKDRNELSILNKFLRKRIFYCNLEIVKSHKYHDDPNYREYINSLIYYSNNQLSLNLSFKKYEINASILHNINKLTLIYYDNIKIPYLKNLHTLDLSYSSYVKDVTYLGHLDTLNLNCCQNIIDVSPLSKVRKLSLRFTNVENVDSLGNVFWLNLSNSPKIKNISKLNNNDTLILSYCINIEDVNGLEKINTLYLTGCTKIKDISPLKNVKNLCLSECNYINTLALSKTVRVLDLSVVDNIKDLTIFKNVHTLNLSHSNIKDDNLYLLSHIRFLNLSYCKNITNVNSLGMIYHLRLDNCKGITNVSGLQNNHILSLKHANITDVSPLKNTNKLDLSHCYRVYYISELCNVKTLVLSSLNSIKDLSSLKNVNIMYSN